MNEVTSKAVDRLAFNEFNKTKNHWIQTAASLLDIHIEAWLEDREDSISEAEKERLVNLVRREQPELLEGCRTSSSVSDTWEYIVNGDCEDLFTIEE